MPKLVDQYVEGSLPIDHFVSHEFRGVEKIYEAMCLLHDGACLRAVVTYDTAAEGEA